MNIGLLSTSLLSEVQETPVVRVEWSLWAWLCDNTSVNSYLLTVLLFAVCIVVPYLIGSINPSIIMSKILFHDDIRTHGSGNAGTTNALRTYGKKISIAVLSLDMLKAGIAVAIGWVLMGRHLGGAVAGFFVVLGHIFPLYHKFKGGKGVACAAIVALIMSPMSFLFCLIVFIIIVVGTKYVSLASVIGIGLYPLFISAFLKSDGVAAGFFAVLTAVFVVIMHRENLKRILNGEESKLSFGKKKDVVPAKEAEKKAEKIYKASDFVACNGCGHTIPITREFCVYCGERNIAFVSGDEDRKNSKKKKKK